MTSGDLSVNSIIKKYEQRQEQLSHSLVTNKVEQLNTILEHDVSLKYLSNGNNTPQFSKNMNKKDKKVQKENNIQKTHKKNESQHKNSHRDVMSSEFVHQEKSNKEYQMLLGRLEKTEDQLVRSQKNYAQMWKKYEMLLKEGTKSGKSVEIEHKLRNKEVSQLNIRNEANQKQISNLKECLNAKDANISILRQKLKQKNQRIVEADRLVQGAKVEIEMFRAKHNRMQEQELSRQHYREGIVETLKAELKKYQKLLDEKEREKRELLLDMEKGYLSHKDQLQVLQMGYKKVQEEYKEWIDNCGNEKAKLIKEYQLKLKDCQKVVNGLNGNNHTVGHLQKDLKERNEEIGELISKNTKLISELKNIKKDNSSSDMMRQELIMKISTLENSMIQKIDYQRVQQQTYTKLQVLYRSEQQKNKDINQKYSTMNRQFQELKSKFKAMFSELQDRKGSKDGQSLQIIRLRKEIVNCRQQFQRSKNNQMTLSHKVSEAVSVLKTKTCKHEQQKQELMTDLLAQRLENVRLKDQLQETKVHIKNQYDLSLQNMRRQLERKIGQNGMKGRLVGGCEVEKEQMYLQMRQLERRYELMASEIVTVDDMVGMAAKVQRRYQPVR